MFTNLDPAWKLIIEEPPWRLSIELQTDEPLCTECHAELLSIDCNINSLATPAASLDLLFDTIAMTGPADAQSQPFGNGPQILPPPRSPFAIANPFTVILKSISTATQSLFSKIIDIDTSISSLLSAISALEECVAKVLPLANGNPAHLNLLFEYLHGFRKLDLRGVWNSTRKKWNQRSTKLSTNLKTFSKSTEHLLPCCDGSPKVT